MSWHAHGMTSSAAPGDDGAADLRATRQLIDDLRRSVDESLDGLTAQVDAMLAGSVAASPTYRRPASVAPRRMEQMTRTPEPTADLDDLVDVLAPRLLERLVPALRETLRDDD